MCAVFVCTCMGPTAVADELLKELESKPINVAVETTDRDISARIKNILIASNWFSELQVTSEAGIITLQGVTSKAKHRDWAESVSYRTENVIAVINKIEVVLSSPWSLEPLFQQANDLIAQGIKYLPNILISLVAVFIALFSAKQLSSFSRRVLLRKIESKILRALIAKIIVFPIIVFGIYIVFAVSGLGSLAAPLIGGTGIVGLIIGIAFRDITENFLASVLLSVQRPFVLGDMVIIMDHKGIVEAMTTRGTVLITLDGNHVHIPNALVYKEPITNLTANPNIRQSFSIGIGYDVPISEVQEIIYALLENHTAVLENPEPLILAESLGSSTVNLTVLFWVDTSNHSGSKVRSSVIRSVKHKLVREGVSMPDDAREIIFPDGIQVQIDPPNHPGSSDTKANKLSQSKPEARQPGAPASGTHMHSTLSTALFSRFAVIDEGLCEPNCWYV